MDGPDRFRRTAADFRRRQHDDGFFVYIDDIAAPISWHLQSDISDEVFNVASGTGDKPQ